MPRTASTQLGIQAFDPVKVTCTPSRPRSPGRVRRRASSTDIGGPFHGARRREESPVVTGALRGRDRASWRRVSPSSSAACWPPRPRPHTGTYDLAIAGWLAYELDLEDVRETPDEVAESLTWMPPTLRSGVAGLPDRGRLRWRSPRRRGRPRACPCSSPRLSVEVAGTWREPAPGAAVYREIDESFEDEEADDEPVPGTRTRASCTARP